MKSFGYFIASLCAGLVQVALRALVVAGRLVALLVVPVVAWMIHSFSSGRMRPARTRRWVRVPASMQVEPAGAEAPSGAAAGAFTDSTGFEVADRIVSIRLDPPVGVINLRVYHTLALVKRDLIVNEPRLRALMKGRRHTLPDVPYDASTGLDGIKDETTQDVERLINELGSRGARGARPHKEDVRHCGAAANAPKYEAMPDSSAQSPGETPRNEGDDLQSVPGTLPPVQAVVAPKVTTGFTYVGKLVKAGSQTRNPKGRPAYEVFEATLRLDNGAELALRGAELERELTAAGCTVGHHVAITPMGKVPVTLGNGGEGQKNLYRVRRIDEVVPG